MVGSQQVQHKMKEEDKVRLQKRTLCIDSQPGCQEMKNEEMF